MHTGAKTFYIKLLQNAQVSIFAIFVVFLAIVLKMIGIENLIPSLIPPMTLILINLAVNWVVVGGLILFFITLALACLITTVDYYTFYFMLDENGLRTKQGLLYKQEISVPYRQIQDIDIDQSFIFQLFGVCKLNILTAGQDSSNDNDPTEVNFPVIDKALAYDLRDKLLSHSSIVVTVPEKQP